MPILIGNLAGLRLIEGYWSRQKNTNYPLLERVRFLGFVCSNLDEFFEIRVSGLIQQVESGNISVGLDGLGPKEQLRRVISTTSTLVRDKYKRGILELIPSLKKSNIHFKEFSSLNSKESVD